MSANAKTKEPQTTAVATTSGSTVPDYLQESVMRDAGQGVSTDAADNLVPLIYVLDAKSPQADASDSRHISGAKAGDIWLRNFSPPIVTGQDGILFQPCHFTKDWVEWRLRKNGGGFVGRHDWNPDTEFGQPPEAKKAPHPENPAKTIWLMPSGNEVKETRYHAGYVMINGGAFPFVIPFSSTGHTVSKSWMFNIMSKRTSDGRPIPSFACVYRLKTKQRTNSQGKWNVFDVTDAGENGKPRYATLEEYNRGKALYDAFVSGEKRADVEEEETATAAAGADDKM